MRARQIEARSAGRLQAQPGDECFATSVALEVVAGDHGTKLLRLDVPPLSLKELAQSSDSSEDDSAAGELEERFVDVITALPTDTQAAEAMDPRVRSTAHR